MGAFSEELDSFPDFELPSQIERLVMKGWPKLKSLPQQIQHLTTSLTSLEIESFDAVEALPEWLGNLTSLTHLSIKESKNLMYMPSLHRVVGLRELLIDSCHALSSWPSGLEYCTSLRRLSIDWCSNLTSIPLSQSDSDAPTLPLLEDLTIVDCEKLSSLPTRLEYCTSLQELSILSCPNLEAIPNLDNLTSLRDLSIGGCEKLSSWPSGLEYCTSLRRLSIYRCSNLTSILLSQSDFDALTLPLLEDLTIEDCKKLSSLPTRLEYCISLETLSIQSCPNLEAIPNLDNLTSLRDLSIRGCDGLTSLPSGLPSCKSLQYLTIESCHNLKYLRMEGLRSLTSLTFISMGAFSEELDCFPDFELPPQIQVLSITGWPKLKSLPQQQIQHATCLEELYIESFDSVEALPEWLGNLTSLNTLSISQCKNLVSLPAVEVMQRLTKLQKLVIDACPRLGGRSALKSGPEWHKISHIPSIYVDGCESWESSSDEDSTHATPSQTS